VYALLLKFTLLLFSSRDARSPSAGSGRRTNYLVPNPSDSLLQKWAKNAGEPIQVRENRRR
jgi:hypothetical protein